MPKQYSLTITLIDDERRKAHQADLERIKLCAATASRDEIVKNIAGLEASMEHEQALFDTVKFELDASTELLQVLKDAPAMKAAEPAAEPVAQ